MNKTTRRQGNELCLCLWAVELTIGLSERIVRAESQTNSIQRLFVFSPFARLFPYITCKAKPLDLSPQHNNIQDHQRLAIKMAGLKPVHVHSNAQIIRSFYRVSSWSRRYKDQHDKRVSEPQRR